jgi:hypothetical protein
MTHVLEWMGYASAGSKKEAVLPETNMQQVHEVPTGRISRLRGLMGLLGRRNRKREWAYHIRVSDYPTGIGTSSQRFSREERYGVLNRFDEVYDMAMADLAATPLVDPDQPDPDDLLPLDGDGRGGRSHS